MLTHPGDLRDHAHHLLAAQPPSRQERHHQPQALRALGPHQHGVVTQQALGMGWAHAQIR
jgi:hypothetical protein